MSCISGCGCGGSVSPTSGYIQTGTVGQLIGTPATNPFTTQFANQPNQSAVADVAATPIAPNMTTDAVAPCSCKRSLLGDVFVALIVAVIVAYVIKSS